MTSNELRQRFLKFFENRGHSIIPSASLVPENDPSVLFNTAGMQPLVPYLLGEKHPKGKRLVNVQKCVRTTDIDDIGDNTHATFFEMLGNWSLGDYWKEEAIKWSYEFLTSKEEGLGLDPQRLYITVFEGDENAPADNESFEIWKKVGIPENRIYFMSAKTNWWSAGENGPCGPDTEMFYDLTPEGLGDLTKEEYIQKTDVEQEIVEVWNDVFMEYLKKDGKVVGKLNQKNVDTGAGLERLLMVMQKVNNIFETDLFSSVVEKAKELSSEAKFQRIIADHIRTSVFMIADGVLPSNTDRGYILRRLLRRSVFYTNKKDLTLDNIQDLTRSVVKIYENQYPEVKEKISHITKVIEDETAKFKKTLSEGFKQFDKLSSKKISGKDAFLLFSSHGFPIDMTVDLAKQKGIEVDIEGFNNEFKKHQELSRAGSEQKFKGGLADTSDMSVKYHTATHLLHQALRDVLGTHVEQKGSNITPERLRFDFSHPKKMTPEEISKVEEVVNKKIEENLDVQAIVLPKEEAEKTGALHFFGEKYGDQVNIYYIGKTIETAYSREFCGGPHVTRTGELGKFKISKEEAVSAGVRRIKAILE